MALKKMFTDIRNDLSRNLDLAEKNELRDSSKPMSINASSQIEIPFHLDGSGNFHYEISKYGAGVTINCVAWVVAPNALFNLTVKSSDGGGGHWDNLETNQKVSFVIKTSFWHNTKISIDAHANVSNVDGKAILQYSY